MDRCTRIHLLAVHGRLSSMSCACLTQSWLSSLSCSLHTSNDLNLCHENALYCRERALLTRPLSSRPAHVLPGLRLGVETLFRTLACIFTSRRRSAGRVCLR